MNAINVFVETSKKRSFAGALDWPGWCRSAKDEESALQVLVDYGLRFGQILHGSGFEFHSPLHVSELRVVERREGNRTTDFGAPAIVMDADKEPLNRNEVERMGALLLVYWQAFDRAVTRAAGKTLQKGPRGGGREVEAIVDHVIAADQAYLAKLAWKHKIEKGVPPAEELMRTRQAILKAIEYAVNEGLPEQGPRGGTVWPVRYFIRRVAWHVLDHVWEIEDRSR